MTLGCFQCTKRRIVCDRAHPICKKCQKKGIECSGLGRFRFTDGVASRGRLKGCAIPAVDVAPEIVFAQTQTQTQRQLRWREGRVYRRSRKARVDPVTERGTNTGAEGDAPDEVEEVQRGTDTNALCVAPWVAPLGARARMLFSHFARDVAPVMVLLDDVSNGYRDLLLPMACTDDLVRQAVEVVATQYLAQLQPSFQHAADTGRAAIISRLRRESLHFSPDSVFSASTWATLIVLLVGETITGSDEYHHLLQTLLCLVRNLAPQVPSDATRFLTKQTHMFQLLGLPLLSEHHGMHILQTPPDQTLDWLAYDLPAHSSHHTLVGLTRQAFTLAAHIYLNRITTNTDQRDLTERLRRLISQIDPDGPGAHALVWACFIAAADTADETHRRFFVERMERVYLKTRFRNVITAVQALPGIWARRGERRWTEDLFRSTAALVM
ncbi:Zn(II)2Cys6 transcription factor [Aspergillus thermomutatus]|uniref:Zn(2)-C6 fungal-type domain-containing protein n=1 Tax=Aspergillus thermomutatus TaxID=41047 RepID=A0A397GX45_ASPTH|nr:uncharacterized protein CDV56_106661 [Aspergillus thermomutatus]RHZ52630.1 hypothetical protein CDV56_106661 [Aspergillus thermomutatus]